MTTGVKGRPLRGRGQEVTLEERKEGTDTSVEQSEGTTDEEEIGREFVTRSPVTES